MKKIATLLMALMCIFMALAFSSCGEPETPEELWDKTSEEMDKVESYKMTMEADVKMWMQKTFVVGKITGTMIGIFDADNYYYYEKNNTKLTSEELELDEQTVSIEAYNDGKRFLKYEENGKSHGIYATTSVEDFTAYIEKKNGEGTLDPKSGANLEFTKNDDKTWTLKCSGFPKKVIEEFIEEDYSLFGAEIEDIELTLTMSDDFLLTSEEMTFVFDDKGAITPAVSYKAKYFDFDKAEKITEDLDIKDYTKIDSFEILDTIEEQIEEHQGAENGSFTLYASQKVQVAAGATNSSYETDKVEYGKKNGSYYYEIDANVNGNSNITIKYENGIKTISPSIMGSSEAQAENEARMYIDNLINSANFQKALVSSITDKGDGKYEIEINVFDDDYKTMMEAIGGGLETTYNGTEQTVTFTIENGKLTKIDSKVESRGSVKVGMTTREVTITIGSIVVFNEVKSNSGSAL
ncbi:MAG: hypothetical protein IKA43_00700 [Clostridia bacterium]|nr:hypothetical protein [Clostridia bacterium]